VLFPAVQDLHTRQVGRPQGCGSTAILPVPPRSRSGSDSRVLCTNGYRSWERVAEPASVWPTAAPPSPLLRKLLFKLTLRISVLLGACARSQLQSRLVLAYIAIALLTLIRTPKCTAHLSNAHCRNWAHSIMFSLAHTHLRRTQGQQVLTFDGHYTPSVSARLHQ
jgi:hypothetical protein